MRIVDILRMRGDVQPLNNLTYLVIGQSNAGNRQTTNSLVGTHYEYLKANYSNIYYEDNLQYPSRQLYNRFINSAYGVDLGINGQINNKFANIEIVK